VGFLASLLPGIRHLRAPLATGYLWLATTWVLFAGTYDDERSRGPAVTALLDLRDEAGTAGLAVAVSFVAYVLGALSQAVAADLAFRAAVFYRKSSVGLSPRALQHLVSLARREGSEAQAVLSDKGYQSDEIDEWFRQHNFPNFAGGWDHEVAQRLVLEDLPLVHVRLAGSEGTRELFAEIDRTKSEAELRLAIWLPLGVAVVAVAVREWGWAGLVSLAPAVALAGGLAVQGIRRYHAANDALVDYVRTSADGFPTFALMRERASTALSLRPPPTLPPAGYEEER
jgi:hypothetical protein